MTVMDCEAVRRLLPALVDSELEGEERAAFEAHVERCSSCRARWRAESRLALSMRAALAPRPVSPELRQRVDRLLRPAPRRQPGLAAAAASLLAAGLALMAAWSPLAHARSELVDVAVDSHLRHAAGRLPLEVRSGRADEVNCLTDMPWHRHWAMPQAGYRRITVVPRRPLAWATVAAPASLREAAKRVPLLRTIVRRLRGEPARPSDADGGEGGDA